MDKSVMFHHEPEFWETEKLKDLKIGEIQTYFKYFLT